MYSENKEKRCLFMKEIHLGQILGEHRRKQKVTQEELACFLGVSKAAVSKWETETAYPDILIFPNWLLFSILP